MFEGYVKIPLSLLLADRPLARALFLALPKNGKLMQLVRPREEISRVLLQRLYEEAREIYAPLEPGDGPSPESYPLFSAEKQNAATSLPNRAPAVPITKINSSAQEETAVYRIKAGHAEPEKQWRIAASRAEEEKLFRIAGSSALSAVSQHADPLPEIAARFAALLGIALGYAHPPLLAEIALGAWALIYQKTDLPVSLQDLPALGRIAFLPRPTSSPEGVVEDALWIWGFLEHWLADFNISLDPAFALLRYQSETENAHPDILDKWRLFFERGPSGFAQKMSIRAAEEARETIQRLRSQIRD